MTQTPHTPTQTPIQFFVPGVPKPQGSKNAYKRGQRIILVEANKNLPHWRKTVTQHAQQHIHTPIPGPIHLTIEFVMPRTKAMRNKPAPPMTQKPDADKLLRAINDALTGTAYKDDSQVTTTHITKRRAQPNEPTGAHIQIQPDNTGGHTLTCNPQPTNSQPQPTNSPTT